MNKNWKLIITETFLALAMASGAAAAHSELETIDAISKAKTAYSNAMAAGNDKALATSAEELSSAIDSALDAFPDSPEVAAHSAIALATLDVNSPIRPIKLLIPFLIRPRSDSALVALWFILHKKNVDCSGRKAFEQDRDGEWCTLFGPRRYLIGGLLPALFFAADNIDIDTLNGWRLEYKDGIEADKNASAEASMQEGQKQYCMKEMLFKAVEFFPRKKSPLIELHENEEVRNKAIEQAEQEMRHFPYAQDDNSAPARLGRLLDKLASKESDISMTPMGLNGYHWRRLMEYRRLLVDSPHLPNLDKVRKNRGDKVASVFDIWYRFHILPDYKAICEEIGNMPGWRKEPCLIYIMATASEAENLRNGKEMKERYSEYAKYLNEILKLTPDDTFVKDRLAGIEREMGNKQ